MVSLQEKKLVQLVRSAKEKSPMYKEKFKDFEVEDVFDFEYLPFTLPEELFERESFVAEYLSENELSKTVDFLKEGMKSFVKENDRVLILMSDKKESDWGTLFKEAVKLNGARDFCLDFINDRLSYNTILDVIYKENINVIVGMPNQIYQLMKHTADLKVETVLLGGEYIPSLIVKNLENVWNCKVFEFYSLEKLNLICAIGGSSLGGRCIRENDIYMEIIDPINGETLPDGKWGEVVITVMGREKNRIIRYRTGDFSRIVKETLIKENNRKLDRIKGKGF